MPPFTEPITITLSNRLNDLETASARMFVTVLERLDEIDARLNDLDSRVVDIEGHLAGSEVAPTEP